MTSEDCSRVAALVVLLAMPQVALAVGEDTTDLLYERAVAAAQEGRNDAAATLFDEVIAKMPAGHPLHALALYGAARASQKVGTPEAACRAVERFKTFIGLPDAEPAKREKAANGLRDLIAKCRESGSSVAAPAPAATASPATQSAQPQNVVKATTAVLSSDSSSPDRTWAWLATGSAGATVIGGTVLLAVAAGAVSDGDAAMSRFEDSHRTSADAQDDVKAADERARTLGLVGYGVLGLGAALGGVATWLWLREPEETGEPASSLLLVQGGVAWAGTY